MVFYRKYRPQTIGELDSKSLRETLSAALAESSTPHAFLFTGPKGLGKTSAARIVAKVVNCERNSKCKIQNSKLQVKNKKLGDERIEPCNECEQCVSITNGTNMDVLEIDGASNRGIDEIRDLKEKLRLSPLSASKKVYIIDEVHMLTTEAFNALLKTLEEPPSHVLFILCTTEPHKVPATIISRCFHVTFQLATDLEISHSLQRIAKGEGLIIDQDSLLAIAKLSEGSFRDAAKILEELASLSVNKKITKELVEEKYKVSGIKYKASEIIASLEKKDAKKSLEIIDELVKQGMDIKYFVEQLIETLHGMMLTQLGVKSQELGVKSQLGTEEVKTLIELLTRAHGEIKYAVLPQLPLEIVVLEWSKKSEPEMQKSNQKETVVVKPAVKKIADQKIVSTNSLGFSWETFVDKVKLENFAIAGVLRSCKLQSFDGKTLVIEAAYTFHKDKLHQEQAIKLLEKVGKDVAGNPVKISVLLRKP